MVKKWVLRARLKDLREGKSLLRSGREFQILGAAALKALEPMLRHVDVPRVAVHVSAMHERAHTAGSGLPNRQESCAAEA